MAKVPLHILCNESTFDNYNSVNTNCNGLFEPSLNTHFKILCQLIEYLLMVTKNNNILSATIFFQGCEILIGCTS